MQYDETKPVNPLPPVSPEWLMEKRIYTSCISVIGSCGKVFDCTFWFKFFNI